MWRFIPLDEIATAVAAWLLIVLAIFGSMGASHQPRPVEFGEPTPAALQQPAIEGSNVIVFELHADCCWFERWHCEWWPSSLVTDKTCYFGRRFGLPVARYMDCRLEP